MTAPEIRRPSGASTTDLASRLKHELTSAVRDYCASEPRSNQVAIGASEIGSPCDRQLALKSLGYAHDGKPKLDDPWAAFIGTAVHKKLEDVFHAANAKFWATHPPAVHRQDHDGVPSPWEIERTVEMAPGIRGKADLFAHYVDKTVIDHKVPADTMHEKAVRGDISETYKVQTQCYGYGFANAGFDVKNVAIAFWARGKGATLNKLHVWTDEYRPDVARAAIRRWHDIVNAAVQLDLETYPERAELFATADAPCKWCPFFDYTGRRSGVTCKGHKK